MSDYLTSSSIYTLIIYGIGHRHPFIVRKDSGKSPVSADSEERDFVVHGSSLYVIMKMEKSLERRGIERENGYGRVEKQRKLFFT